MNTALPTEIWLKILGYCPLPDLLRIRFVSKYSKEIVNKLLPEEFQLFLAIDERDEQEISKLIESIKTKKIIITPQTSIDAINASDERFSSVFLSLAISNVNPEKKEQAFFTFLNESRSRLTHEENLSDQIIANLCEVGFTIIRVYNSFSQPVENLIFYVNNLGYYDEKISGELKHFITICVKDTDKKIWISRLECQLQIALALDTLQHSNSNQKAQFGHFSNSTKESKIVSTFLKQAEEKDPIWFNMWIHYFKNAKEGFNDEKCSIFVSEYQKLLTAKHSLKI